MLIVCVFFLLRCYILGWFSFSTQPWDIDSNIALVSRSASVNTENIPITWTIANVGKSKVSGSHVQYFMFVNDKIKRFGVLGGTCYPNDIQRFTMLISTDDFQFGMNKIRFEIRQNAFFTLPLSVRTFKCEDNVCLKIHPYPCPDAVPLPENAEQNGESGEKMSDEAGVPAR